MRQRYREGLPDVPGRMLTLPVLRGYPVPWFVDKFEGEYDFRIQDYRKRIVALRESKCWLCGQWLAFNKLAFVIGPMCAINRISSEPPSHRDCAEFAARACPFLNQQQVMRREGNLPAEIETVDGSILRQPGVTLVWMTTSFTILWQGHDYLLNIGPPLECLWYREGRTATRAEILESFDSGCPILREAATAEGPNALRHFERERQRAFDLIPAA